MKESVYSVKNLSFSWNKDKKIVDCVNFEIKKGRMTVIAGRNGSGKSTLLKLLANLIRPIKGDVFFYGKPFTAYNQRNLAKHLSFVEQITDERLNLTVHTIVSFGTFPHRSIIGTETHEDSKRINDALNETGIFELKDRYFDTLSGGEKQKVMIARGICQASSVILLDEPTSALDIRNRLEIMELLKSLSLDKGMTVVLISHDFNLIERYADDLILIGNGSIVQGNKEQVLSEKNISNFFEASINSINTPAGRVFYY